jgi:diadenylate cyclase
VLARSDQALQILGRYKGRLDQVSSNLSALEVEDLVTARDVAEMMQRAEMVRRIAAEIRGYVVELGTDGRLVALQLEELTSGVIDDLRYVCNDYFVESSDWELDAVLAGLAGLDDDDVVDLRAVLRVLHLPSDTELDSSVSPRGHRLLAKIPRLPDTVAGKIVEQFGSLTKLMRASIADLVEVEGVGEVRARAIKDGLSRLAETSILDRYS